MPRFLLIFVTSLWFFGSMTDCRSYEERPGDELRWISDQPCALTRVCVYFDGRTPNLDGFVVYHVSSDCDSFFVYKSKWVFEFMSTRLIHYTKPETWELDSLQLLNQRIRSITHDIRSERWRLELGLADDPQPSFEVLLFKAEHYYYVSRHIEQVITELDLENRVSSDLNDRSVCSSISERNTQAQDHELHAQCTDRNLSNQPFALSSRELLGMNICANMKSEILVDRRFSEHEFIIYKVTCNEVVRYLYRSVVVRDHLDVDLKLSMTLSREEEIAFAASYFIDRFKGIVVDLSHQRVRSDLPLGKLFLSGAEEVYQEAIEKLESVLKRDRTTKFRRPEREGHTQRFPVRSTGPRSRR